MTHFDLHLERWGSSEAVVSGKTNREIADELGLTVQAVKNVLSAVFEKCRVRNRVELAVFALRHLLR